MPDPRATVHTLMRGLVTRCFPSQQSASKEIADFWHPTGNAGDDYDTASLSRKMNGSREWSASDVMALSAITGSKRVLSAMAISETHAPTPEKKSPLKHAAAVIKESSEGAAALMALSEGGSRNDAVGELIDIREAVDVALASLDAGGE